jgi:D-alanyl-D-alanine carboxypeptidase (penicillin-binding protein 5/6)
MRKLKWQERTNGPFLLFLLKNYESEVQVMKYFSFVFLSFTSLVAQPLDVLISAPSAILINADTGAILYEKYAHTPLYPASITKIATLLYALDQKNPALDLLVTVSADAVKLKPPNPGPDIPIYWDEIDGTKMGVLKGEILPLHSLMYGLMRCSGNDAANVIAETLSSSVPIFVSEMNTYICLLGCKNTHFMNPHGLHHKDHFTTAYDMSIIAKKAFQIPKFREMVSNVYYQKPKTNKHQSSEIEQKNPLLKSGKHHHPKVIGAKTGFHSKAKSTLVAAAEHEGRTLIAVVLGCEKRTDRYEDVARLFDAAFAENLEKKVFFDSSHLFSFSIEGAKSPLHAVLRSEVSIAYFPSEEPICRAFVRWDPGALPIHKGQKVGEVQICDSLGTVLQIGDLIAKEEVKPTFVNLIKGYVNQLFK